MKKSKSADDIEALRSQYSGQDDDNDDSKGNRNGGNSASAKGPRTRRGRRDRDKRREREDSFPTTYPPPDYIQLDNNLHRARPPILDHNLLFLAQREIDVVMNLSGYPLEPVFLSFCHQSGIIIYELADLVPSSTDDDVDKANNKRNPSSWGSNVGNYTKEVGSNNPSSGRKVGSDSVDSISKDGNTVLKDHQGINNDGTEITVKTITADVDACKDWLIKTLDTLLSLNEAKVLLIGESSCVLDAIVVASLRKLQRWIFTSILLEFRLLTGKKMFDFEQFIESVDLSDVKIPNPAPRCLCILSLI